MAAKRKAPEHPPEPRRSERIQKLQEKRAEEQKNQPVEEAHPHKKTKRTTKSPQVKQAKEQKNQPGEQVQPTEKTKKVTKSTTKPAKVINKAITTQKVPAAKNDEKVPEVKPPRKTPLKQEQPRQEADEQAPRVANAVRGVRKTVEITTTEIIISKDQQQKDDVAKREQKDEDMSSTKAPPCPDSPANPSSIVGPPEPPRISPTSASITANGVTRLPESPLKNASSNISRATSLTKEPVTSTRRPASHAKPVVQTTNTQLSSTSHIPGLTIERPKNPVKVSTVQSAISVSLIDAPISVPVSLSISVPINSANNWIKPPYSSSMPSGHPMTPLNQSFRKLTSPIKRPPSPLKAGTDPIKPASAFDRPSSPVKKPSSPLKSIASASMLGESLTKGVASPDRAVKHRDHMLFTSQRPRSPVKIKMLNSPTPSPIAKVDRPASPIRKCSPVKTANSTTRSFVPAHPESGPLDIAARRPASSTQLRKYLFSDAKEFKEPDQPKPAIEQPSQNTDFSLDRYLQNVLVQDDDRPRYEDHDSQKSQHIQESQARPPLSASYWERPSTGQPDLNSENKRKKVGKASALVPNRPGTPRPPEELFRRTASEEERYMQNQAYIQQLDDVLRDNERKRVEMEHDEKPQQDVLVEQPATSEVSSNNGIPHGRDLLGYDKTYCYEIDSNPAAQTQRDNVYNDGGQTQWEEDGMDGFDEQGEDEDESAAYLYAEDEVTPYPQPDNVNSGDRELNFNEGLGEYENEYELGDRTDEYNSLFGSESDDSSDDARDEMEESEATSRAW